MTRLTVAIMVIGLTLVVSGAYAAPTSGVSLKDLIVLGLKNNLGLEIERIEVLRSREEIEIEDAAFDSELFATTGYLQDRTPIEPVGGTVDRRRTETYNAEAGVIKKMESGLSASLSVKTEHVKGDDLSNALDPYSRTALVIELTQPLLRNFGADVNTTQRRIADNRSRQTALTYLLNAQKLTLMLESAVRQLAGDARVIALRKDAELLARELYQANLKRFEAGLVPVSEVQEAETALASRQLSLSQAQEL